MRWSEEALATVRSGVPWEQFSDAHPEYTYDAWEVKRRRENRNGRAAPVDRVQLPVVPAGEYAGPSICYFDFETTFSTQPRMLSAAGIDGHGVLTVFDLRDYCGKDWLNDREMCIAIRDYLEGFNILASWNGKLFDVPVLNGRLRFWRERPLIAQMHVDLMYYATGQFMRIGRKSLESVSTFFASPHRKTPLSVQVWDRADHGDMDAYQDIIDHNIADVRVTRDLWAHLSPFIRNMHRAG